MRRRTLGPAAAGGSAADVRSTVFALRRSLALAPAAAGSGTAAYRVKSEALQYECAVEVSL